MKALIVADDITGAADTAAPFASYGSNAAVLVPSLGRNPQLSNLDVAAVSTETRDTDALSRTGFEEVLRATPIPPQSLVYKKIDSTLRGHYAAEIAALQANLPNRMVLFCPAFPEMGRSFTAGGAYAFGKPISDTAQTSIALGACFNTMRHISLADVREHRLQRYVEKNIDQGTAICVVDAESSADLLAIASCVLKYGPQLLPAGSGGLARHIASLQNPGIPVNQIKLCSRKLIAIVGSLHTASQRQVVFGATSCGLPVYGTIKEAMLCLQRVEHRIAIVVSAGTTEEPEAALQKMMQGADQLHTVDDIAVFATGGATVACLAANLPGFLGFQIHGEYQVGIPTGSIMLENGTLPLILKSGGFGSEDLLRNLAANMSLL